MAENTRQIEGWPPHLSTIGKPTKMLNDFSAEFLE